MWAVIEVMKRAVLPLLIHTDHEPLVTGLARGRAWTQHPDREKADLWQLIWFHVDDVGGLSADLQFIWVKGHDDGDSIHALGNRYADVAANSGAALHELPDAVLEVGIRLRLKQVLVAK